MSPTYYDKHPSWSCTLLYICSNRSWCFRYTCQKVTWNRHGDNYGLPRHIEKHGEAKYYMQTHESEQIQSIYNRLKCVLKAHTIDWSVSKHLFRGEVKCNENFLKTTKNIKFEFDPQRLITMEEFDLQGQTVQLIQREFNIIWNYSHLTRLFVFLY